MSLSRTLLSCLAVWREIAPCHRAWVAAPAVQPRGALTSLPLVLIWHRSHTLFERTRSLRSFLPRPDTLTGLARSLHRCVSSAVHTTPRAVSSNGAGAEAAHLVTCSSRGRVPSVPSALFPPPSSLSLPPSRPATVVEARGASFVRTVGVLVGMHTSLGPRARRPVSAPAWRLAAEQSARPRLRARGRASRART